MSEFFLKQRNITPTNEQRKRDRKAKERTKENDKCQWLVLEQKSQNQVEVRQTDKHGTNTARDKAVMRKLDTLVDDFPDTYKLIEQDGVSKTYSFPKSCVSYRKPRAVSTEQRERARKMMIERNIEKCNN